MGNFTSTDRKGKGPATDPHSITVPEAAHIESNRRRYHQAVRELYRPRDISLHTYGTSASKEVRPQTRQTHIESGTGIESGGGAF